MHANNLCFCTSDNTVWSKIIKAVFVANAVMMNIKLKGKSKGDYASKIFDLMHITALFGSLNKGRNLNCAYMF